jgi:hypothetical protein
LDLKRELGDGNGKEKNTLLGKSVGIAADPVNADDEPTSLEDLEEDVNASETQQAEVHILVDLKRMN